MVVDSSVWIEIMSDGPLAGKCLKHLGTGKIGVPAVVLFEVYKKIKSRLSEESALEVIASLCKHDVLEFDRETAILAGDLALEHDLAMADSLVLAHAVLLRTKLLTLDNDFAAIEHAIVLRR